jgi:hypothetical protein
MSYCQKCRRQYPSAKLSCPHCAGRKNDEAMRRYQLDRLLLVAGGKGPLTIHRKPSGNHAQMFGPWDNGLAPQFFCGGAPADFDKEKKLILAPEKRRYRVGYRSPGSTGEGAPAYREVCEKCRAAIEELLTEAREAEAMKTA